MKLRIFTMFFSVLIACYHVNSRQLSAPQPKDIIAEQRKSFLNALGQAPKEVTCSNLINHELMYPSAKVEMFCNEAYRYCLEYHILKKHAKSAGAKGYNLKFIEQITKNKLALCQTLFKLAHDGNLDQLDQDLLR